MKERFFFDQDQDSHWYMVPEVLREKWQEFTVNDMEDNEEIDRFESIFGEYRTGGGISQYSFEKPIKT